MRGAERRETRHQITHLSRDLVQLLDCLLVACIHRCDLLSVALQFQKKVFRVVVLRRGSDAALIFAEEPSQPRGHHDHQTTSVSLALCPLEKELNDKDRVTQQIAGKFSILSTV